MRKTSQALVLQFLLSVSVLSFEISATRISSVIFVNSYAFAVLSLSILGLATGAIFFLYKSRKGKVEMNQKELITPFLFHLAANFIFVFSVIKFSFITSPAIFFLFLFLPFFAAGWFYSQVFKIYSNQSYKLYAADLAGAAVGAFLPLILLGMLGPIKGIIITTLTMSVFLGVIHFISSKKVYALGILLVGFITILGVVKVSDKALGAVPIGDFEDKDIYHVYDNPAIRSRIVESRWSVFGRSDLVEHSNQKMVKHLFVDGAAGSQMYRFNGDIKNQDPVLSTMLAGYTNFIPFLILEQNQRSSMLVIGPGGGKEILTGLISEIGSITGVELNKDFIEIVEDEAEYNGGIYTDFPNVNIFQMEGRQYVRETERKYDLVVMALPSTQQLQSIESYALNENYLLTVESLSDYLSILTDEGELILTVHNNWELRKLISSVVKAFELRGIAEEEVLNHLMVLDKNYAPTLVVRKNPIQQEEVQRIWNLQDQLPAEIPPLTYLPYSWNRLSNSQINSFIAALGRPSQNLEAVISQQPYNISPVYDDNPYFYNLNKGAPKSFYKLLAALLIVGGVVIALPVFSMSKRKEYVNEKGLMGFYIIAFGGIGLGFMLLEVSLFQKMILYLGSPTISLSVLLSAILIGMGIGSLTGSRWFAGAFNTVLVKVLIGILLLGVIALFVYPTILNNVLHFDIWIRSALSFILIFPLGYILGIPFPSFLTLLKAKDMEDYIPWMYAINGAMSVVGSVSTIILSMMWGFSIAFFAGLLCYVVVLFAVIYWNRQKPDFFVV